MFISCKNNTDTPPRSAPTIPSPAATDDFPVTETTFDYEVKELKSAKKMILTNQELPDGPECTLAPGDTLRLCRSYNEGWHVEGYYKGWAEIDHCEEMANAVLISIKKINCHIYKAPKFE